MEYQILSVQLTLMKARSRQHSLALMMVHNFYNRKLKVFTKFFLKNLPKGHLQPIFFLIINIQYMQVPDSCQNVCQILCPFICPVSFFLNNVLFSWPGWALTLYIECLWEWNVQWPWTYSPVHSSRSKAYLIHILVHVIFHFLFAQICLSVKCIQEKREESGTYYSTYIIFFEARLLIEKKIYYIIYM